MGMALTHVAINESALKTQALELDAQHRMMGRAVGADGDTRQYRCIEGQMDWAQADGDCDLTPDLVLPNFGAGTHEV